MANPLNIQVVSLLKLIDKKIGDCYMKDTIDSKDINDIRNELQKANEILRNIIKIKTEEGFDKSEMVKITLEIDMLRNKIEDMDLKQNNE